MHARRAAVTMTTARTAIATLTALAAFTTLAACSVGGPSDGRAAGPASRRPSWSPPTTPGRCRRACCTEFTAQTGYPSRSSRNGDAGKLTNKLVLTKGVPTGDVAFGIDNTFASRALDAGVLRRYTPPRPAGAASAYALPRRRRPRSSPRSTTATSASTSTTRGSAEHHLAAAARPSTT